jgi:hypothetical protein
MKTIYSKIMLVGIFLLAVPKPGYADLVRLNMRCSEDTLEVAQAIERVEWAVKCGHITDDDKSDALFTGGSKPRTRPMYPLFATEDLASMWKAPVDRNAPCTVPPGFKVMAFCTSSCYTPDQVLLFPEGYTSIKVARDLFLPKIVTLDEESSLGKVGLKETDVASYTEEVRNAWHDILVFNTENGGELKVTKNHPIIDQGGKVRAAESFKVGDALMHVDVDGSSDSAYTEADFITSVTPVRYFGKVYNVTPKTDSLKSNIVIAQGFLNGSAHYQNEGANYLNRKILRSTIPARILQ